MTTVAYVLKMYPRFSETFIVNEILELERQGLDVRIYSLRKPDDGRFHANLARVRASVVYVPQYPLMEARRVFDAHGCLLRANPARYARVAGEALARGQRHGLKRFWQAGVIAEHLLQHPVHALHAHFATAGASTARWVHRLTGLPYSFTAHAKDIFHQDVSPGALRRKMSNARFVVTVSDFNSRHLEGIAALKAEASTADIRRLYNGIDLDIFRPAHSTPREAGLILGVGRLVEKKGWQDLIGACALLAEQGVAFRCEIIGKGALEARLRHLIAEHNLGDRVILAGARPQDEVLTAYRRATVFALPCVIGSDGNRDGLPTVLLEAMAAGLPVVSTGVTGVPEIIAHAVDGLIASENDITSLAACLRRMLTDQALRQRLAAAARCKVELEFDVRKNVAVLHRWLVEPTDAPVLPQLSLAAASAQPVSLRRAETGR